MTALSSAGTTQAAGAIVEDVIGHPPGVTLMDSLAAGRVIRLGASDTLVLTYGGSCWHERISGGTVTIGAEKSDVAGGKVDRTRIDCRGSAMTLTAPTAGASAGVVFRHVPPKLVAGTTAPAAK